jgi:predicted metal-dependent hydrolase
VLRRWRRRRKASPKSKILFAAHKERAREVVHERLAQFNAYYGFSYNKVFIKNSRSRWGSCSSKKNLNFNFRIVALRQELQDYLIVHELCHLAHFDHSREFWQRVTEQVPDAKRLQHELRRIPLRF